MNKAQWKEYRRNWRLVKPSLYAEDSHISYERGKEIEKHFQKARTCEPRHEQDGPSDIPYLWSRGQDARKIATQIGTKFNPVCVANAARSRMRTNVKYTGREEVRRSYPVYWSDYENWEG